MELAFDQKGNPIRFRSQTRKLRPRRWKHAGQRGTCAAVLDADGEALFVDADADFAEFRAAVGNVPGFYRLDQCDADGIAIDDAPPAYVTIESRHAQTVGDIDPRDALIRDLVHSNAELARTVIERFAEMMQASAVVLRAADGAGLPRREPAAAPAAAVPPPDDDDDDDDDHDDADDDREPSPSEKLWAYIEPMLPAIQMWIASLAAQRSSPSPAAAPPVTPEQAAPPAPAASSAAPVADGVAAGPSAPEPLAAAAPVPATTTVSAPAPARPARSTDATSSSAPIVARNAPPSVAPTAEQWTHLFAIRARLLPRELAIVERTLARMTTEMRAQWLAELSALTVEQATAAVRAKIPAPTPRTGSQDDSKLRGSLSSAEPRNAPMCSEPTPEQWAHLAAIRTRLSPRELAIVERTLARTTPERRAKWLAELSLLTVEDATAAVRAKIPAPTPRIIPKNDSKLSASAPSDGPRAALPSGEPTPEQWAHLFAVQAQLSPPELAIIEQTLIHMPLEVRARWLAELSLLTVEDATAAVQAMLLRAATRQAPQSSADAPSSPDEGDGE